MARKKKAEDEPEEIEEAAPLTVDEARDSLKAHNLSDDNIAALEAFIDAKIAAQ